MGIFEAGFEKPSPIQVRRVIWLTLGRSHPCCSYSSGYSCKSKERYREDGSFCHSITGKDNPREALYSGFDSCSYERACSPNISSLQNAWFYGCWLLGKHMKLQIMVTTGGTSLKDDILRLNQTGYSYKLIPSAHHSCYPWKNLRFGRQKHRRSIQLWHCCYRWGR